MPYDLHTHSSVSDGTTSPAEVMRAAAAAGLTGVALTDHDSGAGLVEAATAAADLGMDLVGGVEMSTSLGGRSVHLLRYGDITTDTALAQVLRHTVDSRLTRLQRIVAKLQTVAPTLRLDDVMTGVPAGVTPGRPHIADALVRIGAVHDRDEAFVELLAEDGPYYVGYHAPALHDAVGLIVAAGGVAVIAHPGSRAALDVLTDDVIADLVGVGLSGLEVDHRDHDDATRRRLRGLAGELGLVPTGASDYHGAGKQNEIGECTTADDVVEDLLGRATAAATG